MVNMKIFLSNFVFVLSCFPAWLKFVLLKNNFQNIQNKKLLNLIKRNKNTLYGKKYNFEKIKSVNEFQNQIPISEYEDYSDYIEKIKHLESNVLTSDRVRILEPTSGSSGAKKYIPYNEFLRREFQSGIKVWIFDLYINFPKLFLYKSYWSISPKTKTDEQSDIKIGFEEDEEYFSKFEQAVLNNVMIKPDISQDFIKNTKNILEKEKDNTGLISIWSPTYIKSIFGSEIPKFKNLQVLSCWADASSKIYAKKISKRFPNTFVQPKGLLSTEGIVTFPFNKYMNVVSYLSHFYEFADETGKVFLLNELEKDKNYTVIMTTSGGLYRYNTHDTVYVKDFYKKLPVLEFVGRDNNVSDYFGEKLSEHFLKSLLDKIFDEYNFALFKFENDRYVLYTDKTCDIVSKEHELENLLEESYYYKNCIELNQLNPVKIIYSNDCESIYISDCIKRGMKLGDIKIRCLDNNFSLKNQ